MPAPPDPIRAHASLLAESVGIYRIMRLLGEGATGRVYLAERTDFVQRVALKVFHSEFFTTGAANESEPFLLASLDHRHIVRVLQQGTTQEGVRYLAMEYVEGEDIVSACNSRQLMLPARTALLLQVLEAVEYAHRHLVLHGDLKPANILVAEGEVKIVDFGSAVSLHKEAAAIAHTPAFASPEQRAGARVTVASDIYSLGVLARLLLLREARPHSSLQGKGTARADLEAIVEKALQLAPEDRYPSAAAMAADLRAFIEGRTPLVRNAPLRERLRKWILRNKLGAAMTVVLALVLLFSAVGVTLKAVQARRSRRETEARLRELVRLTGMLQSELYGSVRSLPDAAAAEKLLTDSAAKTLDGLAASNPADPTLRSELSREYAQLAQLESEQAHTSKTNSAALTAQAAEHLRRARALQAR